MKANFSIIALLMMLVSLPAWSQDRKPGTVEVIGKSEIAVAPDQVNFNLTINATNKDFTLALDDLNKQVNQLKKALQEAGIQEKEIQTVSYDIQEDYQYEGGNRNFIGYKATHSLEVKKQFEDKTLKKVYGAIKASGVESNMRLSFTLSDPESYRKELMEMAVLDAKEKAMILAAASGNSVGAIKRITYGTTNPRSPVLNFGARVYDMEASSANISVNPGDLKLFEQVNIIYYLGE